jgi:hypothetical protein
VLQGWLYIEVIVKIIIPILLLSNLPILIFTMPRLHSLGANDQQPLTMETKTKFIPSQTKNSDHCCDVSIHFQSLL